MAILIIKDERSECDLIFDNSEIKDEYIQITHHTNHFGGINTFMMFSKDDAILMINFLQNHFKL
jgi:hypothetical protein